MKTAKNFKWLNKKNYFHSQVESIISLNTDEFWKIRRNLRENSNFENNNNHIFITNK